MRTSCARSFTERGQDAVQNLHYISSLACKPRGVTSPYKTAVLAVVEGRLGQLIFVSSMPGRDRGEQTVLPAHTHIVHNHKKALRCLGYSKPEVC